MNSQDECETTGRAIATAYWKSQNGRGVTQPEGGTISISQLSRGLIALSIDYD